MAAPIIVALTDEFVGSVTAYLQGYLRTDRVTIEAVREALEGAARFETPAEPEPDLFGSV